MVDYEIIGKIRAALIRKGLSQRDLAELTGVNETAVSRWMAGKVGIGPASLRRIEAALDINLTKERMHTMKTALITGVAGQDGSYLSEFLLEKEKIALVPGEAFGENGAGFIRMSFANSYENIVEGCRRLWEGILALQEGK